MSRFTVQPQVIDEILAGDALSLAEAARLVPAFRPGRPTNSATVWRWAAKGIRLPNGTLIKLETCRIGGRQMTSRAALGRFILAQTLPVDTESVLPSAPPSPSKQRRLVCRASEELNKIGI